jgi:Uncharacterized conserved protein (DUF2190)
MATESPLIHDGGQTQAAADLSANQFYVVTITGARLVNLQTTGGGAAYGILQNKPTLGQAADVGILGVSKAAAGAAFAAGAGLMTDTTGRLIAISGTTNRRVATAIEAATAAGQLITVALNAPFGALS